MTVPGHFAPLQAWASVGDADIALAQPEPLAGDLMIATVAVRPSTVTIATPSGWDLRVNQTGTDGGAEGADTGSVRLYQFTKTATGSEGSTTVTFTKTGTASVITGNIDKVRSATGTYDVLALAGAINADATSWQVAGLGAAGNFVGDDLVVMTAAQNGDLSNTSTWDVFGTAFGASTKSTIYEHGEFGTITGNDLEVGRAVGTVLPGTSNTGTVTLSVTQSVACSGVLACLRIRQGAGVERDDAWIRSTGQFATGSTSLALGYPEHRAGDMLLAFVTSRGTGDPTPSTPAGGWQQLGTWNGGTGVFGVDAGNARLTVFYLQAASVSTGTLSVTITGGNVAVGQMVAVAKPDDATWATPVATGNGRTAQDPWSLALAASVAIPTGAVVIAGYAVNTDAMTGAVSPTMSASGVTFAELVTGGYHETSTGNDAAFALASARATVGASATPTVGIDWTGTGAANYPAGAIGFVVVALQGAAPVEFVIPSATIAVSGGSPSLVGSGDAAFVIPPAPVAVSGGSPSLVGSGDAAFVIPAATVAVDGVEPALTSPLVVVIPSATIAVSGGSPSLVGSGDAAFVIPPATIGVSGPAPVLVGSGDAAFVIPPATIAVAGVEAVVSAAGAAAFVIPPADVVVVPVSPVLVGSGDAAFVIPPATIAVDGVELAVSSPLVVVIPPATIAVSGATPALVAGGAAPFVIPPATIAVSGPGPVLVGSGDADPFVIPPADVVVVPVAPSIVAAGSAPFVIPPATIRVDGLALVVAPSGAARFVIPPATIAVVGDDLVMIVGDVLVIVGVRAILERSAARSIVELGPARDLLDVTAHRSLVDVTETRDVVEVTPARTLREV